MRTWLFNDDSLTARLTAGCAGKFRVEVLKQRYARAHKNEARLLGIPFRQVALLREVTLYCDSVPVVYARSIIPLKTLTGKQKRLAYLGDRPLGGFLFSCPSVQRDEVQLAHLRTVEAETVWGRRSIFRLAGKPLLVTEIFLPGITGIKVDS